MTFPLRPCIDAALPFLVLRGFVAFGMYFWLGMNSTLFSSVRLFSQSGIFFPISSLLATVRLVDSSGRTTWWVLFTSLLQH